MKSSLVLVLVAPALLGLIAPRHASACINDRDSDTLAQAGQALPGVLRVITGRFERNPPLYFQMRAERITRELQAHPERLPLYDDIAVACDRLGKQDEAIAWMDRKWARLKKLDTRSNASSREALYRYYANNGTFWAHRWLRRGADRTKISEMKTARKLIAQAIHIKPNAHFGREKYQLMTMDWIIDPKVKEYGEQPKPGSLGHYISKKYQDDSTEGLSGLIVLGAAWESLDVFNALRVQLHDENPTLAYLAILRSRELIANGKRSLLPGSPGGASLEKVLGIDEATLNPSNDPRHGGITVQLQNQVTLRKAYRELRAEADTWQVRRTAYMMSRLQQGQHPDTNKSFWRGWRDSSPTFLELPWYSERAERRESFERTSLIAKLILLGVLSAGVSILLLRARRRRVVAARRTLAA